MARKIREIVDNGIYHVIARGSEQMAIFREYEDYERYLGYLRRFRKKLCVDIYCFALMPNHVHLVLKVMEGKALSRFMHWIHTAYGTYFNCKYERVGHLFQGRFQSKLVQEDTYLLYLTKYVHLNPVKAGLVKAPEDYSWSSYLAYLGKWVYSDFVCHSFVMEVFAAAYDHRSFDGYRSFVESGSDPMAGSDPSPGPDPAAWLR